MNADKVETGETVGERKVLYSQYDSVFSFFFFNFFLHVIKFFRSATTFCTRPLVGFIIRGESARELVIDCRNNDINHDDEPESCCVRPSSQGGALVRQK